MYHWGLNVCIKACYIKSETWINETGSYFIRFFPFRNIPGEYYLNYHFIIFFLNKIMFYIHYLKILPVEG